MNSITVRLKSLKFKTGIASLSTTAFYTIAMRYRSTAIRFNPFKYSTQCAQSFEYNDSIASNSMASRYSVFLPI